MFEYKLAIIYDILETPNTYEKIKKFKLYSDILGRCKILLFDEAFSNLGDSFKEYKVGKCGIYRVGDYTKTWVIDSDYMEDIRYIPYGKTIDFDLNILTYLNKIMRGKKINAGIDRTDVIKYFNYIKENGFQFGITTALMERATKPINSKILFEMLTSFERYQKINHIDNEFQKVNLNLLEYYRVLKMYRQTKKQINKSIRQFDSICCCVIEAYLIKKYDKEKDLNKKVDKFITYCLRVLNCYMEKEIVLLSLYILDDSATKETFKKLNKSSKINEHLLNTAWDIYHIRLLEQIMLIDNVGINEQIILSYCATADKGLIDAMKINPIKAFVILDDYPIAVHNKTIQSVCQNMDIMEEIKTKGIERMKMAKVTDYAVIKQQLLNEVENYSKSSII